MAFVSLFVSLDLWSRDKNKNPGLKISGWVLQATVLRSYMILPDHQDQVSAYMGSEKISVKKSADLKQVISYYNSLAL